MDEQKGCTAEIVEDGPSFRVEFASYAQGGAIVLSSLPDKYPKSFIDAVFLALEQRIAKEFKIEVNRAVLLGSISFVESNDLPVLTIDNHTVSQTASGLLEFIRALIVQYEPSSTTRGQIAHSLALQVKLAARAHWALFDRVWRRDALIKYAEENYQSGNFAGAEFSYYMVVEIPDHKKPTPVSALLKRRNN